jgi:hypothetical protein
MGIMGTKPTKESIEDRVHRVLVTAQSDNALRLAARKEYKLIHGHFPEEYKKRMKCAVCTNQFQKTWDGISNV